MATGRIPDPNSAPITAKGDLYTYSTVPARLAVGSNGDTLVADSSATTGLRWQQFKMQNPVINSALQVWQRGTSISIAASTTAGYSADRWSSNTGANGASTISRQATGDTTNLPNIQYCARVQRNSGQTGTGGFSFYQSFESLNSYQFAGQTVVFSFYARKGSNYSSASDVLTAKVLTGTGTDQNVLAGYTGLAQPLTITATLTSTWQRFQGTATLSSSLTELALGFEYTPVGTASTNDYYEVTGVQLEIGSIATAYRPYSGTLQGELAACQRYYSFDSSGNRVWTGNCTSGSTYGNDVYLPVTMRVAPTVTQTHSTSSGFPGTTPGSARISTNKFYSEKTSDGTTTAGFFQITWTASAEL